MISRAMEDVVLRIAKGMRSGVLVYTLDVPVHTRRTLRRAKLVEVRMLRDGRSYFVLTCASIVALHYIKRERRREKGCGGTR